jgi:hypothetical protein
MTQFYFSRKCGPNPLATRWIDSGVIDAPDLETAQAALDAACAETKSTDRATTFAICDLSKVEIGPHGLVALTTGGAR